MCNHKFICNKDDCSIRFEKSFASHEKVKFWNYDKNKNILPINVHKYSHKKIWFNCDKCYHIFNISLDSIIRNSWCQY
jgi:hypothetical protein